MHLKRWITAIIAVPVLVVLIRQGGWTFAIFLSIVALVSLWEYFAMVFKDHGSLSAPVPVLGFVTGGLMVIMAHADPLFPIVWIISANLILAGCMAMIRFSEDPAVLDTLAKEVQGIVYIPLLISFIVLIRDGNEGMAWIFFLLFLVFLCDTGAFYVGSYMGRNKLCPGVSPGKTIEGALGGMAACVTTGLLFRHFFLPSIPLWPGIGLFICVSVVAPCGDLFESMIKRACGIKDSGRILPGHGGILDRIDALMFAAPVVYFFKIYLMS